MREIYYIFAQNFTIHLEFFVYISTSKNQLMQTVKSCTELT